MMELFYAFICGMYLDAWTFTDSGADLAIGIMFFGLAVLRIHNSERFGRL